MKIPQLFQKKKYQAATAAAARRATPDNVDEPNIKLSNAVIVVVALHLVAVGGIYAFTSIKAHQPADPDVTTPEVTRAHSEGDADDSGGTLTPVANVNAPKIHRVKTGETLSKIAATNGLSVEELASANGLKSASSLHAGQEIKIPTKQAAKPIPAASHNLTEGKQTTHGPKDSGEFYTVAKGDNPVAIARKLHVSYDDLLKLNKIEDPKKLQIGQRLHVPVKLPK